MKKIIATVLMLTMLLASFAACNNDSDESSAPAGSRTESTTSDAVSADLSSGEEVSEGFPLEAKFYDTEITILVRSNHTFGAIQFVGNEDDDEVKYDRISDEVKSRNDIIETEYGITINAVKSSTPGVTARDYALAGDDTYDLVFFSMFPSFLTIYTSPSYCLYKPDKIFNKVVFPHPFSPTIQ